MKRTIVGIALTLLAPACAERADPRSGEPSFEDLTREPGAYDGRVVRVESGYLSSFEVSVLTSGFAESYPPQPVEPTIWVDAAPPEECLDQAEGTAWSERVVATGTFRYDPDNGFGHLGAYPMAMEQAELDCA